MSICELRYALIVTVEEEIFLSRAHNLSFYAFSHLSEMEMCICLGRESIPTIMPINGFMGATNEFVLNLFSFQEKL